MKKLDVAIGKKLKQYREIKQYSLQDVASLVDFSRSTIHAYETGRNSVQLDKLVKICKVYGIDYIEFLNDVQRENKKVLDDYFDNNRKEKV